MRVKLKQNLPNVMHLRRTCMYVHYVHMHKIFNTSRYTHSSQTNKHTHTQVHSYLPINIIIMHDSLVIFLICQSMHYLFLFTSVCQ